MAASAFPFQNNSPSKSQLLSMCISPLEVLMGSNVEEQMYCHLLCGLRKSESIDNIRSPYAVGLIKAIRLLESKWKQMCEDIKNGSVSSEIKDSGMKDSITEFLDGPHLEISKRIENLLQGNEWNGILGKLWPNLRYVSCVLTGSMEQYYPLLKFYANDVALIGGDYFASECCIAINMDKTQPPEKTSYVMLPTAAYFEFLPFCFGDGIVSNETKNFSSVEVGKMYELVATTYRGLYRYRLGDIIKVVGFYNSSPQVEYVTRAPKLLSEILTERELMSAMQSTQLMLNNDTINEISEFTSFLDVHSIPKRLVIFLEVRDGSMFLLKEKLHWSIDLLNRYSLTFESFLGAVYKEKREMGYMGPLHSCIVKPGSFDILQRFAIESGSPANQYKSPLILRRQKMIELMKESVVLSVMAN